jgi:hypothetical protein
LNQDKQVDYRYRICQNFTPKTHTKTATTKNKETGKEHGWLQRNSPREKQEPFYVTLYPGWLNQKTQQSEINPREDKIINGQRHVCHFGMSLQLPFR